MTIEMQRHIQILAPATASLCALFIGIQFIRTQSINLRATSVLQTPAEVGRISRHLLYGCYSNQSKLSWFDRVAPVYWIGGGDVKEAMRHLNFSESGRLPLAQQRAILFEAVNQIQLGAMPPKADTGNHQGFVVTSAQTRGGDALAVCKL